MQLLTRKQKERGWSLRGRKQEHWNAILPHPQQDDFLAGLLNRSSLSFILVSVVRLISIIAILFAFAMNLYLIVINIQGVHHHLQEVSADSGSQKRDLSHNTTNASSLPPATSDCGYINGTNVPTTFGDFGHSFFVLGQVFNMIILILCLLSELSFPPLPKFFQVFFPPLGQSFGVGFLGSLEFCPEGGQESKKAFKNLKPSMISKPQATSQNPFQTPDTKSVHHPLEISRPIIDYIQQRKAASATANPNHPEHSISLPAEPSPIYSSFKTIVSEHSKRSKDTLHS
ncbi:hypothetical protein KEM48_001555 [Puccinia striiformis f. sp. tritici PST-130]|nr:hypothetical protein KEM48_001555 [Puccinia striiformis f. sp. tritici PST-130]